MLCQHLRLRALHLHANQRLRHILGDRFLPIGTGRRIRPQNVVAAVGVIELDEGSAAIARVQLHAVIRRVGDHIRRAHAHRIGAFAVGVGIVAAEDRHIAAAAAGLVEKTPRRSAGLERRDHFQQNGIDRQQRVFEAVFGDVTVAITLA